ncbi:MAG: restriction endonuclease subunit S, partial [Pseudanabaena sp.]
PEYLLNYLRLPSTRRFIVSKSDKVAITNINQGGLSSLPVLQPSKEEQQEIADILSSCDSKIATLEREINLHDELFRAMLEELMTGKLSSLPLA